MNKYEPKGRAKGGVEAARSMTKEERLARAQKGAIARWGAKAIKKGNFKEHFGIDVECFVLEDEERTAAISQTGMGAALGLASRGNALPRFISGKGISEYVGAHLMEKLGKPLKFQWSSGGAHPPVEVNGYDVTLLIDLCHAVIQADADGKLQKQQEHVAKQASIIVGASAKAGIKGLVYALAGYRPEIEEVISAFKHYVLEEAKKYEREFPPELYVEWQRLYNIKPPPRGKNWKELHLTLDHVYYPLAKSNGKLLELLRSAKTSNGDRNTKLFSFLNEVGARALRIHLGRILEMAESAPSKEAYEAKIAERFGGQMAFDRFST
jgi:hypothetical protein